jgi:hypothetical protein
MFIQFAGFTFGKTQSFFDVWAATGVANANLWGYDDTGNGINLAAYTAMLGNGVSLSIAAEDPQAFRRMNLYAGGGNGALGFGTAGANEYGGTEIPDIVGTLRVDQAWGSAMVGGLIHQIRGVYYHGTATTGDAALGRPSDKWGWAVTGGADINLPWAKGDRFIIQGTYTEGVMGTVMGGINNTSVGIWRNQSATEVTVGWIVDATRGAGPVAGDTDEWKLTTGWAVIAGLEHYWVPNLRSSVYGSYVSVRYPGSSTVAGDGKANLCAGITGLGAVAACNPDLNLWNVGTRTVWSPVPNLDLSVEAVYSYVDQNHAAGATTTLAAGAMSPGVARSIVDQGVWAFNFRVQRNFWP